MFGLALIRLFYLPPGHHLFHAFPVDLAADVAAFFTFRTARETGILFAFLTIVTSSI